MIARVMAESSVCEPHCSGGDAFVVVAGIIGFCFFCWLLLRD